MLGRNTSERHITWPIARPKKKASVYSKERETHALILKRTEENERASIIWGFLNPSRK